MSEQPVLSVVFFRRSTRHEPVRDWLKKLEKAHRKVIGEDVKLVQFRWPLGMPLVRKIESGLWEVRSQLSGGSIARIFLEDSMNKHSGSSFDSFLEEEGILEEVSVRAHKRYLALQIEDIMLDSAMSRERLAEKLHTSHTQVDQLLDPENTSITLETLDRLARAVGKQLKVEFA